MHDRHQRRPARFPNERVTAGDKLKKTARALVLRRVRSGARRPRAER
jgi:hypothetical protein